MKSVFISLLLMSVNAFSCPDLMGQWTCQSTDGNSAEIAIDQEAIPGGILYKITNYESGDETVYQADGIAKPVEGEGMTGTEVATCKGDALIVSQKLSNESMKLESSLNSEFKLVTPASMTGVSTRIYSFEGKPIHNSTYETSCSK